jgi:hypothetical protein
VTARRTRADRRSGAAVAGAGGIPAGVELHRSVRGLTMDASSSL